jgi:uncharacterized membrane protein YoaK (UPF0700 family)
LPGCPREGEAMPANEDADASQKMALSEFSALRNEIASRSTAQHTLINLSITAIGAVVGLALAKEGSPLLLLILPILSPSLGMLYLDHAMNIARIGNFINDQFSVGYEKVARSYEQQKLLRVLPYGLPIFIIFAGAPMGSLLVIFPSIVEPRIWILWSIGLILVILYLYFWILFMLLPYWTQSVSKKKPLKNQLVSDC